MSEISAQTGNEIPDGEQALLLQDDKEILIEAVATESEIPLHSSKNQGFSERKEINMIDENTLQIANDIAEGKLRLANEKIANLEATLETVQNLLAESMEQTRQRITAHEKDVHTIAVHLVKAAREYDWCGTYDTKIEYINDELTVKLPPRNMRYWVEGKITLNFRTEMMMDFDIEEESNEDKEREARNYLMEMGTYDLQNAVDHYSREFTEINVRKL